MDQKQNDEHTLLTKQKLLKILSSVHHTPEEDLDIASLNIKPGTPDGVGYASEMAKVDVAVRFKRNNSTMRHRWMVKMSLEDSFTDEMHLDDTEIEYYSNMLPRWSQMSEQVKLNACHVPYTEMRRGNNKRSIIVMEDLNKSGFRHAVNLYKGGFTLEHTKLALTEVAKFHALSYAFMNSHDGGLDKALEDNKVFVTDYLMVNPPQATVDMFKGLIDTIPETVRQIQDPGQGLEEIYDKFSQEEDLMSRLKLLLAPKEGGFNVVCHGDLGFFNIMFKYYKFYPITLLPIPILTTLELVFQTCLLPDPDQGLSG